MRRHKRNRFESAFLCACETTKKQAKEMMLMRCGTTPTHIFTVPFDVSTIKTIRVIYVQNDRQIVRKCDDDVTMDGNTITLKLTQEDTLKFRHGIAIKIQVRILTVDGTAMTSDIIIDSVKECLDDEVLV